MYHKHKNSILIGILQGRVPLLLNMFCHPSYLFSHWLSHNLHMHQFHTQVKKKKKLSGRFAAPPAAVPSSVWLKPQSRQMDDTQRFMSSSDSATRYQVRSSVFRSKTKVPSSSFLVKDRPASTSRTRERDKLIDKQWGHIREHYQSL